MQILSVLVEQKVIGNRAEFPVGGCTVSAIIAAREQWTNEPEVIDGLRRVAGDWGSDL